MIKIPKGLNKNIFANASKGYLLLLQSQKLSVTRLYIFFYQYCRLHVNLKYETCKKRKEKTPKIYVTQCYISKYLNAYFLILYKILFEIFW